MFFTFILITSAFYSRLAEAAKNSAGVFVCYRVPLGVSNIKAQSPRDREGRGLVEESALAIS